MSSKNESPRLDIGGISQTVELAVFEHECGKKTETIKPRYNEPKYMQKVFYIDYRHQHDGVGWLTYFDEDFVLEFGWFETKADCLTYIAQLKQARKNSNKILMPKELTAENGAKLLLSGEFFIEKWIPCKECEGQDYMREDEVCVECDNEGGGVEKIPVGWDLMRDIYKMAVKGLGET